MRFTVHAGHNPDNKVACGAITVSTDGAAKLGKYLDFHNSSASTNNFDTRL